MAETALMGMAGQGAQEAQAASPEGEHAAGSSESRSREAQPSGSAPGTEQPAEAAAEDLIAEFESLIQGKFKDIFEARMQEQRGQPEAVQKLLQRLSEKYGVEAGDLGALSRAVEGEQAAPSTQGAGKVYDTWLRQAQEAKELYPAFSMEEALREPRFRALLRGGADVRTAYEAVNVQRIIPAAMALAAKVVEGKLASSMAAASARPGENAALSRAASVVKADVSKLSRAQIEDVSRRVARGERISFG